MRIVAVADTHMYEAELGVIPDGDVFVHAGDLLRKGTLDELRTVVPWIQALPHRSKVVVAGNHDWCFQRHRGEAEAILGEDIQYLEDSAVVIDGALFWGSPWQPRYRNWAFNLDRGADLAEKWARIPAAVQVLVTHGPPHGFGDRTPWPGRKGCVDLAEAVQRLRVPLHLFGHIHTDGGKWTSGKSSLLNVTTSECERGPTVVDFEPSTGAVDCIVVPPQKG